MTSSMIESLTRKERDCLRLVTPERKSAVIADELGIAVSTVETHIMSARRKLGGVTRFAAARMLSEHEGRQPLTSEPLRIVEAPDRPLSTRDGPAIQPGQPMMLSDVRPTFDHGFEAASSGSRRANRNDLSMLNRLALIAFCIFAMAIAGIASIPLSSAVQHVARMVMTQRN